jgi:hypothetical protein
MLSNLGVSRALAFRCSIEIGVVHSHAKGHTLTRLSTKVLVACAAVTVTLVGSGITPSFASGGGNTPEVLPPNATPFGMSYGQWSAREWQWALESPDIPSNPVTTPNHGTATNPAPVDCTLGQSGPVWFLSGVFVSGASGPTPQTYLSCSIPAGKALFFPVIDAFWDNVAGCEGTPPTTFTAAQLAAFAKQTTDSIVPGSMSVTVDGRSLSGLEDNTTKYRATAYGWSYTLPADNAYAAAVGCPLGPPGFTTPPPGAFADGVFVMLAPLSPGVHHISFAGRFSGALTESVTYTLTVTPNS